MSADLTSSSTTDKRESLFEMRESNTTSDKTKNLDPETTIEIPSSEEGEQQEEPERMTLVSYYFVIAWSGAPIPNAPRWFQIFFDCCWIFSVPFFGMLYCLYLIITLGVFDSIMWLFIELGAVGCWSSFFYSLRWKMAYKPYTFSKEVWKDDLTFVLVGVALYAIIAGVYFSAFTELMAELPAYGKVIEGFHGITSWARFGAIAATAQAFYASASSRIHELHELRLTMEKELQQAFNTRKSTFLIPPRERSIVNYSVNTYPGSGPQRNDLIGKWIEFNRRTHATNKHYSWFIAILITTQSIAFLTWALNNLISSDSAVNSVIAGTVILGTTVTTIFIIAIGSQLTSEMEKSAAMAAEYWYCTPQAELRALYPGLAASITLHLLQRDYATKVFDFSISKNFLFEFLGAVTSLTLAVLRLQATLV